MKKNIILFGFILGFASAYAQKSISIPVRKLEKHIALMVWDTSVEMEGYDGDDLIIEVVSREVPEVLQDAAGLKNIPLGNAPRQDTGITYTEITEPSFLHQINLKGKFRMLHLKVPNNMPLFSVSTINLLSDSHILVKNYKGNLNISATKGEIRVSHVIGPFSISSESGKIVISDVSWTNHATTAFSKNGPYRVSARNSDIDVTVPADLKADLNLRTDYGEAFSNLPLDKSLKLNGGGLKIELSTLNGNIYLRK